MPVAIVVLSNSLHLLPNDLEIDQMNDGAELGQYKVFE
jgi:hypothetical protein